MLNFLYAVVLAIRTWDVLKLLAFVLLVAVFAAVFVLATRQWKREEKDEDRAYRNRPRGGGGPGEEH